MAFSWFVVLLDSARLDRLTPKAVSWSPDMGNGEERSPALTLGRIHSAIRFLV